MTQTILTKPNLGGQLGTEFPALQALSSDEFAALQRRAATEPGYTSITLHTKPRCVQCNAVKRDLGKYGLVPDECIDLSLPENSELMNHIANVKSVQQVPFTVYGSVEFSGFNPDLVSTVGRDRLTFLASLL